MRTATDVVLAKPGPTRDELASMAAEIRQAVDHSERLIEVLLVLARNDQAHALTDPLDLATVAEDALEGRTANGITTTPTLDEAPVTGDRVLLERLVANLLDNAERYNFAGGTVAISTSARDATSVLRVVNTGTVVPANMVERLLLPFTRLNDRTRHRELRRPARLRPRRITRASCRRSWWRSRTAHASPSSAGRHQRGRCPR